MCLRPCNNNTLERGNLNVNNIDLCRSYINISSYKYLYIHYNILILDMLYSASFKV